MSYYIAKTVEAGFEQTIGKIEEKLKEFEFGVLTRIDINEKLKEKLDVDFRPYAILGACNPALAYKGLQKEDKLGVMLPCNIIVQQLDGGKVEVAAVNPVVAMETTKNSDLLDLAREVHDRLEKVLNNLDD
jgi:uncharacterized protein (DUF302 family)